MVGKLFLSRNISRSDIFFCFVENSFFLKKDFLWLKVFLPAKVFLAVYDMKFFNRLKAGNFLYVLKFFFFKNIFWNIFWNILTFEKRNTFGFYAELELIGLGFRIVKVSAGLYRFFWGYANYIYMFVPDDVIVEYSLDERSIFFFSTRLTSLNNLSTYLILLKKMSVYRIKGFVRPGKIIRLNSGKQR